MWGGNDRPCRERGVERLMGAAAHGGKGFEGRAAVSGPIGAATWRQQHDQASRQPPPPVPTEMRHARYQLRRSRYMIWRSSPELDGGWS